MVDVLLIDGMEVTFPDTQVVDSIQQIGLAAAVITGKTDHPLPE